MSSKIRKLKDKIFTALAFTSLLLVIIPLIHIILSIIINGISAINIDFLTKLPQPPGTPGGGIVNAIEGTAMLVFVAMMISFPPGLMTAIYLSEYGKGRHVEIMRNIINTLSGMPSIVAGILAYTMIVVYYGFSAISGAFALSLLAIPYIIQTSEEAIRQVPRDIREAGLALGLPKWKVTMHLVVGAAKPRIITGLLLAMTRIIGEAAPLLFTAFGSNYHATSLFEPVSALPLLIFIYATSPFKDWQTQAWGAALILMVIVLIINIATKLYVRRMRY